MKLVETNEAPASAPRSRPLGCASMQTSVTESTSVLGRTPRQKVVETTGSSVGAPWSRA
jgi:hypothetical protein